MVDLRFFACAGPFTLDALLGETNGEAIEPRVEMGAVLVGGAAEIEVAQDGDIVLAGKKSYALSLEHSNASVAIVGPDLRDLVPDGIFPLVVSNPQVVFTQILEILYPHSAAYVAGRSVLDIRDIVLEDGVTIGTGAVIGSNVEIGAGSTIGANSVIGSGVTIGRNTIIGPHVSIECAHLGDNVLVHAGARIGTQGFGWLDHGKSNMKVPQLGRVIIQDRVEVGANTTIDRGALGDTSIGEGSKIDNLVQIVHNCRIGRNCLIAAATGLSGSTIVGDGVLMGGGVGSSGHLSIGDGSIIHGRAAVTKDWPAGSMLAGAPAQDIKGFWRELALLRRLGKVEKR